MVVEGRGRAAGRPVVPPASPRKPTHAARFRAIKTGLAPARANSGNRPTTVSSLAVPAVLDLHVRVDFLNISSKDRAV